MPSQIRLPTERNPENNPPTPSRPRAAIGYRDLEDGGEDDSLRQEINRLNKDSALASHIERNRSKSSGLLNEAARWREPLE